MRTVVPISIACPQCGAEPGTRCHTDENTPRGNSHRARVLAAKVQRHVDSWNENVKVGAAVLYMEVKHHSKPVAYKTASAAFAAPGGHTAVIHLEGKTGWVALGHCVLKV
jgi:hypothetical protein